MKHYFQWSAVFASYFAILGLWVAFGPDALMTLDPVAAPRSLAAISLVFFVAMPFSGWLQKRLGFAHALVILGGGVLSCLLFSVWMPRLLLWTTPSMFFFGSGTVTLCEMQLIEVLAGSGQGAQFGRARKWGSLGYVFSSALGGAAFALISGARSLSVAMALCAAAFFGLCLILARACLKQSEPKAMRHGHAQTTADTAVDMTGTVASPAVHRYLGATAISLLRLAETATTTLFGAFWLATGHSTFETGLLCALPVVAEFVAMWRGSALMARWSPVVLLFICSAVSVVRWLATPYCSALWCAVPLQAGHAFTFGVFFPTSLLWLRREFGGTFFRTRYFVEAMARALAALILYVATDWAIGRYGYLSVFGTGALLALLAMGWWGYAWWAVDRLQTRRAATLA